MLDMILINQSLPISVTIKLMWTKGGKGVRKGIFYDFLWEEWKSLNLPKTHLRQLRRSRIYGQTMQLPAGYYYIFLNYPHLFF